MSSKLAVKDGLSMTRLSLPDNILSTGVIHHDLHTCEANPEADAGDSFRPKWTADSIAIAHMHAWLIVI